MNWREQLALLLGAASPFAATGPAAAAMPSAAQVDDRADQTVASQPLEFWSDPAHAGHLLQLASHSSHRSHSSHSSHVSGSGGHSSHYSGSGITLPSYSPPAPVYSPSPPPPPRGAARPAPLYSSPVAPSRSKASPGPSSGARLSQDDISKFVQRVQIALMVKGYDPGPADGDLKPQTREALKAYQAANGLEASGNMDMPTLHALGVLK